jgi:hypothetical protein
MYMVYWIETEDAGSAVHGQAFDTDQMRAAMDFMEQLRRRQRDGEGIGFVTLASEHPHAVGHPGVADPAPDYNWKKRRR